MTATITQLHPRTAVLRRLDGDLNRAAFRHVLAGGQLVRLAPAFDDGFAEDLRHAQEHGRNTRPVVALRGNAHEHRLHEPCLNLFSTLEPELLTSLLVELAPTDEWDDPGLVSAAQRVLRYASTKMRRPATLKALSEDLFAENAHPKTAKGRVSVALAAQAHVFAHSLAGRAVAAELPTHDLGTLLSYGDSFYAGLPELGQERHAATMGRLLLITLTAALTAPNAPHDTNLLVLVDDSARYPAALLKALADAVKRLGGQIAG